MRRFLKLLPVILAGGLTLSFVCGGDPPEEPAEPVKCMTVEYDWIEDYDMGSEYDIRCPTDVALYNAARTVLDPYRDEDHRLPFFQVNNEDVPFPATNMTALLDYAQEHRHPINDVYMDYHFLVVDEADVNQPLPGAEIAGVTSVNSYSEVWPEGNRFTFIFWEDIVNITSTVDEERQTAIITTVHELGHQRYGLRHFQGEGFDNYHDQSQDWCVMLAKSSDVPSGYRDWPRFCDSDDGDDTNSCADWLKKAN